MQTLWVAVLLSPAPLCSSVMQGLPTPPRGLPARHSQTRAKARAGDLCRRTRSLHQCTASALQVAAQRKAERQSKAGAALPLPRITFLCAPTSITRDETLSSACLPAWLQFAQQPHSALHSAAAPCMLSAPCAAWSAQRCIVNTSGSHNPIGHVCTAQHIRAFRPDMLCSERADQVDAAGVQWLRAQCLRECAAPPTSEAHQRLSQTRDQPQQRSIDIAAVDTAFYVSSPQGQDDADLAPVTALQSNAPVTALQSNARARRRDAGHTRQSDAAALAASRAVAVAVCRAGSLPQSMLTAYPGRPPADFRPAPQAEQRKSGVAGADDAAAASADNDNAAHAAVCEEWAQSRAGRRQRIVVGIARASGDGTFMATIDEVLVLPELRRQGLGRRYDLACNIRRAAHACGQSSPGTLVVYCARRLRRMHIHVASKDTDECSPHGCTP